MYKENVTWKKDFLEKFVVVSEDSVGHMLLFFISVKLFSLIRLGFSFRRGISIRDISILRGLLPDIASNNTCT